MKRLSLVQLKEDQKCTVVEVAGGPGVQHRLMSMGIYPGREITKLSHFALRGPVAVRVGRSVIALGHGMASRVMVSRVYD